MIKKHLLILLFIFFSTSFIIAQSYKLYGKAEPGNIMIGKVEGVKEIFLDDTKLQVDKNGIFIFGFDRDAKGTHTLLIKYNNSKEEIKKIKLPKRNYVVQKLKIAEKYVTPPKEELDRIEGESQQMKAARSEVGKVEDAFFANGFIIPSKGRISGVFGSQRILNGVPKNPHNGIDIAADEGTPVYATSDGIVRLAGNNFYYNGNFILLDHGQGLTSVYLHMSKLLVKTGDTVKKGDKIGEVGSTGRSTSAHLHWGVQWYGKRIDPISLLEIKF
jgi:murein DD-endopeptidase MepM/ murein hydrolase activator NlpD